MTQNPAFETRIRIVFDAVLASYIREISAPVTLGAEKPLAR